MASVCVCVWVPRDGEHLTHQQVGRVNNWMRKWNAGREPAGI